MVAPRSKLQNVLDLSSNRQLPEIRNGVQKQKGPGALDVILMLITMRLVKITIIKNYIKSYENHIESYEKSPGNQFGIIRSQLGTY